MIIHLLSSFHQLHGPSKQAKMVTSRCDRTLESWELDLGNHPQMAFTFQVGELF